MAKDNNYKQASEYRKMGLLNQMSARMISGEGIGSSIGTSIKEQTKAYATGVKETFDPLNIAKRLTFGSSFGPALVGKLLGRSDEDIEYFAGEKFTKRYVKDKKRKQDPLFLNKVVTRVTGVKVGDTIADSLGKIYTLFKKIDEQDRLERQLKKDFKKESEKEENDKHQEILEILKGKSIPEKIEPSPDTKKETKKKPKTTKKTEPTAKKPRSGKPKIVKRKPKETLTSKVTSYALQKGLASTAVKVVVAAGAVGVVGSAIAGAESQNDPNISFGDRYDPKTKKYVNITGDKTPEQMYGKKLTEMSLSEVKDFGKKRGAHAAAGKYQFMPTTLFGRNNRPGLVQQAGLTMDTLFDSDTQELLYKIYEGEFVRY